MFALKLSAFERADSRGVCRVGVCARGRENAGGESGIVSAAVLSLKHEETVEHLSLLLGVLSVGVQ